MITLTRDTHVTTAADNFDADGRVGEPYSILAHRLRSAGDSSSQAPRSVGVTSCAHGEGASTVAANLAVAAAEICERPVLLIDLNTARPGLPALFGMTGDLGLRDALSCSHSPGECARPTRVKNLSLLAVDPTAAHQPIALESSFVNDMLQALRAEFDLIVLDLPTADSSDCFALAGLLDGVLLVVESERTRCEVASRAKRRLTDAHANLLGVVLNKKPQHIPDWLYQRL